jgi:uncharacterized membrane protein
MDLVGWYLLFAVTTSLASIYELWSPVMGQLSREEPDHNMIQYKFISYMIFFTSGVLLAPIMVFSCIIPSFSERFRTALLKSLKTA